MNAKPEPKSSQSKTESKPEPERKNAPAKTEIKTETKTEPKVIRTIELKEDGSNVAEVLEAVQYVDSSATTRRDIYAHVVSISTRFGRVHKGGKVSIVKGGSLKIEHPAKKK